METTLTQWAQMAVAALAGLAAGLWYDGLSMARVRPALWTDCLLDALFWAGSFFLAALALYAANGLKVRSYLLLCMAAGFSAWRFAVSPLLLGLHAAVCRMLSRALTFAARMLR